MIETPQKFVTIPGRVIFDSGVMSCRDLLTVETRRQTIQRGKLQAAVTSYAGDRCLTIQIAGNKGLDYIALEVTFQVEHVEGEAKFFGDSARVVNVVERTAARRQRLAIFINAEPPSLIP